MEISQYAAILFLTVAAIAVALGIFVAGRFIGVDHPTRQKKMVYEAGSDPLGRPKEHRFSVKFYMVAISFILFDLETVFVMPWAISWGMSKALGFGLYSLGVMLVFVAILTIGLVYEWKQGGLEWE